jgi:hypothetical protein
MPWWVRLKYRPRRLLGMYVPAVGYVAYVDKDGELKQQPVYIDQFYK